MASPILHIKDAYYFEVPKAFYPSRRAQPEDFPDVWIRLDPDFQEWEAEREYQGLVGIAEPPAWPELQQQWQEWTHEGENFGKPLDVMLQEQYSATRTHFEQWQQAAPGREGTSFTAFVAEKDPDSAWFVAKMDDPAFRNQWAGVQRDAGDVSQYLMQSPVWSAEKIDGYNWNLSGKILIPQPFGELRNLHEPEPGSFCISKFMVIEVVVALIMLAVFSWVARKISSGKSPRGRVWNLCEVFLVYLRDEIAKPVIGKHDADRFTPFLWTLFMFVLGCNLCGLLPWVGAPTSSFGVTISFALLTFAAGIIFGMRRFGPIGFFKNQVPSMDLPLVTAIVIKPMLFVIELVMLCIKHSVLGIRLLANMVAGHLVLLGIMGLAFGAGAVASFGSSPGWTWWLTALISIAVSVVFSCLELFVAFLQAYIITFLSALFIGAAIHHH